MDPFTYIKLLEEKKRLEKQLKEKSKSREDTEKELKERNFTLYTNNQSKNKLVGEGEGRVATMGGYGANNTGRTVFMRRYGTYFP
jgi:hypothetical protein